MSFNVEIQNNGLFVIQTQLGKPLLDGYFRPEVPAKLRMKVLHQLSEAPAMEELLAVIVADLKTINDALAESMGEGALGHAQARQAAPRLFELVDMIEERLAACDSSK